jgi:hypothetical protein
LQNRPYSFHALLVAGTAGLETIPKLEQQLQAAKHADLEQLVQQVRLPAAHTALHIVNDDVQDKMLTRHYM